jgi:hypothetical protein
MGRVQKPRNSEYPHRFLFFRFHSIFHCNCAIGRIVTYAVDVVPFILRMKRGNSLHNSARFILLPLSAVQKPHDFLWGCISIFLHLVLSRRRQSLRSAAWRYSAADVETIKRICHPSTESLQILRTVLGSYGICIRFFSPVTHKAYPIHLLFVP